MTPIDIQVSRSKVSVEGQAYSLYVGGRGALVFYKQLYLKILIMTYFSQYPNLFVPSYDLIMLLKI